MSNPEVRAIVEAGIASAAQALGLPGVIVEGLSDLFETLAGSADPLSAVERLKQNALADTEDAAAEAAADALLKAGRQ